MKEAAEFVRRNRAILASRPVWLFSSGPLGAEATDVQGRDLRVVSEPKEFAEFRAAIDPRDDRVFFGALDRGKLGFAERLVARMGLPEGDFRDWQDIDSWAESIARELAHVPAGLR